MKTYRTASGVETHRIPVELTLEEAIALAAVAPNFDGSDLPLATGLARIRHALAIEAPEYAEEPEWARG